MSMQHCTALYNNNNNNNNNNNDNNNNWLSACNDCECILAMLLGSNKNGRIEVGNSQYLPLLELSE